MPRFYIQYTIAGNAGHKVVEANDEGQARIRFLNLETIAFQNAGITSIEQVADDKTVAAKPERVSKRKVGELPEKGWRETSAKLTAQINAKAEEKQKLIRKANTDADWLKVDAITEELRKLTIERDKIVKKNAPGAARA